MEIPPARKKLVKIKSIDALMADLHKVEGTNMLVLELLMFGFAYSSYYLLVTSPGFLENLDKESVREELNQHPTHFGRKLEFNRDLEKDSLTKEIFFLG